MTENKTIRKCAIYARVSTQDQNLENQIKALKTYANKENIKVYKVYREKVSGTKDSRPELMEMLKDAKEGCFDIVIVWKLDRLGRSLPHLIKLVGYFQQWNVDFICTTQNIDTTNSSCRLVFHIMGAVAEFERELISERTKLGLKNAKNVGKRGKDRKARKKGGYYLRYQKKGRVDFSEFE